MEGSARIVELAMPHRRHSSFPTNDEYLWHSDLQQFPYIFLIPAKSLLTPKTDADVFQAKAKETPTIFLHNFLS